jgi:hypothetical protein
MAEHGFLFTDPLARAILRGEKIDTRRPMSRANTYGFDALEQSMAFGSEPDATDCRVTPGDTLWVREAWRVVPTCTDPGEALVSYRAGGPNVLCKLPVEVDAAELSKWNRRAKSGLPRWTPSLLMPRWAARSVRRVLAVHAERLGPLTVEQARDEGFGSPAEFTNAWDAVYRSKGQTVAARPWVWVIRFGMPEAAGR